MFPGSNGHPRFRSASGTKLRRCLGPIVAACCLSGGGTMGPVALAQYSPPWPSRQVEQSPDPLSTCERAAAAAEQAAGLPSGLLMAIGRVESGRWDGARGRVTAWPWAINAAGKGAWFATRENAIETVRTLLNGGTRSIDVGCFQISLLWHPTAFDSLEQAFDPAANARYAARFLLGLFSQTGSWETAVEDYHSADPALGYAYRQQVFATWLAAAPVTLAAARAVPAASIVARPQPVTLPVVIAGVRIWTPTPAGSGANVVAMPAPELNVAAMPPGANMAAMPAASGIPSAEGRPAPLPAVTYRAMPPGLPQANATRAMSVMPRR